MTKAYTFEALGLLHSSMNESVSNIVSLASRVLNAPVSFVSVLESENGRQFLSAFIGFCFDGLGGTEMPIKESICQHVQAVKRTVAIPDLLEDARTRGNAFALENGLRSYIGTPIHTSSGKFIGSLCCMGSVANFQIV